MTFFELCSICGRSYDLFENPIIKSQLSSRSHVYFRSSCSSQCWYYYLRNRNRYYNICTKSETGLHRTFKQCGYGWPENKITQQRTICVICRDILQQTDLHYFDTHCSLFKEQQEKLRFEEKVRRRKIRVTSGKNRHLLFKKYNYRCAECGATNKETTLHIDHIKPIVIGGTNNEDNLQVLCKKCNLVKHTDEWVGGH